MDSLGDVAYLVFGQSMPGLDVDVRHDVVELMNDGDFDLAPDLLVGAIDQQGIPLDAHLLAQARKLQPRLA